MRFKGLDLNLLVALDVLIEERSVSRALDPSLQWLISRIRAAAN